MSLALRKRKRRKGEALDMYLPFMKETVTAYAPPSEEEESSGSEDDGTTENIDDEVSDEGWGEQLELSGKNLMRLREKHKLKAAAEKVAKAKREKRAAAECKKTAVKLCVTSGAAYHPELLLCRDTRIRIPYGTISHGSNAAGDVLNIR